MTLMNPETEKFYQDLFNLTSRPEWETFRTYCEDLLKSKISTAIDLESLEDLNKAKGQVDILRSVVSFRDLVESQYEFIQAEELNEDI